MFNAEYLLFCAGKAVDEHANLSLHGIFDRLYAASFPVQHRPFKAVFKLTAVKPVIDTVVNLKISLNLNDKQMATFEGQVNATVEQGNALVPDVDLSEFVFPSAGNYTVTLHVNDKKLIERQLLVASIESVVEK